jgi:putative Mg2+ transporter-C (MgtC) family protein
VTGIGFLGAGTIIQTRGSVHGLTTAATIWVIAGLGLAVGLGSYWLAGIGALLAVIVLNPFQAIEHAVRGKKTTCRYSLLLTDPGPALVKVMKALEASPSEIKQVSVRRIDDQYEIVFDCTHADEAHPKLVEELSRTEGVAKVSISQEI